jgi:DNA-directed RNA polymerase
MLYAIGKHFIVNYKEGINNPFENPILLDASCNGLQHLSSMTRDVDLAKQTNVIGNWDDNKEKNESVPANDLYTHAANLIQKHVEENEYPESIKQIKFTRKLVKKSIMTIPYNISLIGIQEQIRSHTIEIREFTRPIFYLPAEFSKLDKPIRLYPSELKRVGTIVYTVFANELPSLNNLRKYLDSMSKIILGLDSYIYWITPTGIKVNLSNQKLKSSIFQSRLYSGDRPITISLPTNQLDKQAIKRSWMPNLIHSLDSANIQLFVNKLHQNNINIPFYTIHDCFASLPNSMSLLETMVKEAFIEIYFSDNAYVQSLHHQLLEQIRDLTETKLDENRDEIAKVFIRNKEEWVIIPKLPYSFTDPDLTEKFIKGLTKNP